VLSTATGTPIRVLVIEDSEDDAELILRALRGGGYAPQWRRVDTPESMRAALDEETWDVVIADFKMPGFSGLAALRILKERGIDVPFILASGVIGEEVAVEAMRAGAHDYVMKRNLTRLPPAIARELREAEVRRQRRCAEEALHQQLQFTRALSGSLDEGVCAVDVHGRLTFANPAAQRMLGWTESELIGCDLREIAPVAEDGCPILEVTRSHSSYHGEDDVLRRKDGTLLPVSLTASPLSDGSLDGAVVAFQDITERKRVVEAEHFLARASEALAELLDYERALVRAASLCVPDLADVCAIVITEEEGVVARVAVGLPDIHDGEAAPAVTRQRLDAVVEPYAALTAAVQADETAPPSLLRLVAGSAGAEALLAERGPYSALRVAMRGRGRIIGTLILLATAGRARPDAGVAHELAHRAAMAIDNARLYHEAQQAIRVRDEFLSIASHELRTPLTPLKLQIQDLAERARTAKLLSQPPERVTARLENAARQVDRVTRLVSNLLDVTRIVAGRIVLEREPVELVALVREVLDRAEPEAQRAGYHIKLESAGPIVGRWDRLRIDQVVTNLVSNALKYGGGKPIEIAVRRVDERAVLRVCDHGIGVAREQLDRIFGRFERAVSERSYGGLGLGLYIVRRFVEAHGGTVRVDSTVGEGSVFIVELPLA
jgi:PAS domain S-box-containing protein